jgi:hypothetical protein
MLNTLGPVTIRFAVEITQPVELGHHGIALFNNDGQLIWANAKDSFRLHPGIHEFCYAFSYLPLRPGSYSWRVSLYDSEELVDAWESLPRMIVATENYQHPRDEWNGALNIPSQFEIRSGGVGGPRVAV